MKIKPAIKKPSVHRLLRLQILTIVVVAICSGWWGASAAYSAALGGLVVIVGNSYFSWRAFQYNGTRFADKVVGSFYRAEIGKFVLMATLLVLVFKLVTPLHTVAMLIGFIVTLLVASVGAAFVVS